MKCATASVKADNLETLQKNKNKNNKNNNNNNNNNNNRSLF